MKNKHGLLGIFKAKPAAQENALYEQEETFDCMANLHDRVGEPRASDNQIWRPWKLAEETQKPGMESSV